MKYIELTQNQFAIIDDEDFEKVNKYNEAAKKYFGEYAYVNKIED